MLHFISPLSGATRARLAPVRPPLATPVPEADSLATPRDFPAGRTKLSGLAVLAGLALWLLSSTPLFAAFGLTTSTDFYTVDTGANLVFKVRRTDNGSSTQSAGDLASLVYNGVEYQNQTRGSQINSGFDWVYNGVSAVTVNAAVVDTQYIKVTVTAGNLTHYYLARNGYPHIYMATHFTTEPDTLGLCRYIVRIPSALLPNGPVPSDIRGNTGAIESADIFGMADGTTRSKHYSNMRLKDWSYIGATGTNVGMWMLRSDHEGDSGGPFYRSLLNQCGGDQEITYIINYGEAQTEAYRTNILNGPYVLAFTNGSAPTAPDTSWVANMGLTGFVGGSGRGEVSATGITGRDAAHAYTVGFANATAQYWTDAAQNNGAFTKTGMLPGTYTMKVYKNELAVHSAEVTVSAGATTALGTLAIAGDPSTTVPMWRIGNWDGAPNELLNGDKVTTMHPSDARMAAWNPGTYVIGTSTPATGMPCYQWKDVNGSQAIQFQLTAAQLVNSTVRIGITCAFEGARPKISLNSWTYPTNPAASSQPGTRTLTVGTYRGNNATYTYAVPASALVAGTNTLWVFPISGSGATGYLSAGYSLDSIDFYQGTARTLALAEPPANLTATPINGQVSLDWDAAAGASSYTLHRATTSGGPYVVVATDITDTSYTDTNLTNGTTYYYTVSATNSSGTGMLSPEAVAVLATELHAYLPFDETAGTVAGDHCGFAKHGTLTNGPLWAAGYAGNAVDLDGTDDYVALPAGVVSGLNDFTIAAWVNPDAVNSWARLFDFGTGTTNYMFLAPSNGSALRFAIRTPSVGEQQLSGPALTAGVWTHVAVTLSGNTGTLYVNGTAVATHNAMTLRPSSLGNTTNNWIGRSQFADPYLNGRVDDFRLYNRALDASEVGKLRGASVPAAPGNLIAQEGGNQATLAWPFSVGATSYRLKRATTPGGPYTTIATLNSDRYTDTGVTGFTTYYYVVSAVNSSGESANSSPVAATPHDPALPAWWKFDESGGTLAADSAGFNTGTLAAGAGWGTGRIDNAVSLNGTSISYVSLPAGVVSTLNDFSIATWVYVNANGTWARLFDFGTGPGTYMFLSPASGANTVRYSITTNGGAGEQQINSAAVLSPGTWHHVAVTLSGNTGTLYLDGVAAGTNPGMTLKPSSLGNTTLNYIGKSQYADPYLNGRVDDFRIYSRALSASEISTLASPPGSPPATPSGLNAVAVSSSQIDLDWSAVSGATGYQVKRATLSGGPYTTIATNVTGTSYNDTGLGAATTFHYVVSAVNAGGESGNSVESTATTLPATPVITSAGTATGTKDSAFSYQVTASHNPTSYGATGLPAGLSVNTGNGLISGTPAVAGTFNVTLSATNAGGTGNAPLTLTLWNPLPAGWTSADIGAVGIAGNASENAGTFSISGSGADIWGTADSFRYASQTLTGDGEIRARVTSISNTDPWAKAGVMIRDGSGAGATNAFMLATASSGFSFQWRATASGVSNFTQGPATHPVPNNWVRLVRSGNLLTGYTSADGVSWTQQGTTTVGMASTVSVGLAVTSHNNTALNTATFDNVSITPYPSPWLTADIGTTGLAGGAEYFGGAYTVKGAGTFGGTSDGFRYVYQALSADGSIVARVSTLGNTGSGARVGVMIRDTLAANSRMAALSVNGSGAYRWERRTTTGGSVSNTNSSSGTAPNLWIRLVRAGNVVTASKSTNGTSWTTIGSATVTMASSCHIGLAVASGGTTTLNTSVFDNVTAVP